MKFQLPQFLKGYILQFADLYHRYQVDSGKLRSVRYRIHSSLAEYQQTRTIQLAITDKPGDFLPPVTIEEIKKTSDILSGLHPIDVNSINDLFYLSHDSVKEIRMQGDTIEAINHNGDIAIYDVNEPFDYKNSASRRISFMMGHIQAERMMRKAYAQQEKYKVIHDNITTLDVWDAETSHRVLMNPLDILFSEQYKFFAKEDVMRIGYICGQMSRM